MHRLISLAAACAALAAPAIAQADDRSLLRGDGQRPGPDLLYADAATAPQLENSGIWRAAPILVSGATAYRDGELLYQDFLYDDHGARAEPDPADPRGALDAFSEPNGTYTYPTAAAYASNAADLVELRLKPTAGATAFRLTLNAMTDPALVGATIAIGTSDVAHELPHGANVSAPAQLFLTWHGDVAELRDAATGALVEPAPTVTVDETANQVELRVPHAAWDPGRSTVRLAAGVGLWDAASDRWLLPGAQATETTPGGAGGLERPAAFFNVAFRADEPLPSRESGALGDPAWWRDRLQGEALAAGGLGDLHLDVDFAKLADGTDDASGVPRTGPLNRILVSRFSFGEGVDWADTCFPEIPCTGELRGQLQPYGIYVPRRERGRRFQLTLQLHSLTGNYNQYSGSRAQREVAHRARPSIVITPEARGPDGFYNDVAGADVFEVWADVARRYRLDPRRTSITGYSMGGYGTFKLVSQFPDLFARAQPTVGTLQGDPRRMASARWVPILQWNDSGDELVPPAGYEPVARELRRLGYRHRLWVFPPFDPPPDVGSPNHVGLAVNDQFAPTSAFLRAAKVVRNPPRVTFAYDPALDFPRVDTVADHAYWVTKVRTRREGIGIVDVQSLGYGVATPEARTTRFRGEMPGGTLGPLRYRATETQWEKPRHVIPSDRLEIHAENVAAVRIDARRARVSCRARLSVDSDGPLKVKLFNCPKR